MAMTRKTSRSSIRLKLVLDLGPLLLSSRNIGRRCSRRCWRRSLPAELLNGEHAGIFRRPRCS